MNDVLIRASKLTRRYDVGKTVVVALSDVELTVRRPVHRFGRAIRFRQIHFAQPHRRTRRPTSGEIQVNGLSLGAASEPELVRYRRERVGFIFQSFNLLPTLTALENVEAPMMLAEMPRSERRERALALLDSVGLAPRVSHKPNELSGGEKQRVAIARALANRPLLLLADEPTGNLDSKTGAAVLNLLYGLLKAQGLTMIMVTHDAEVAARANRIIHLRDGSILNIETSLSRGHRPMTIPDQMRTAVANVGRRKLRSALASLGVVVGTLTIVIMVSLAAGVRQQINRQFAAIGLDRLTVSPSGSGGRRGGFGPPGPPGFDSFAASPRKKIITAQDVADWKKLPGVTQITPEINLPGSVGLELKWHDTNQTVRPAGTEPMRGDLFQAPPEPVAGSLELPEAGGIVVSQGAAQALGLSSNAFAGLIGQHVEAVLRTSRGETQSYSLRVQGISHADHPASRSPLPTGLP